MDSKRILAIVVLNLHQHYYSFGKLYVLLCILSIQAKKAEACTMDQLRWEMALLSFPPHQFHNWKGKIAEFISLQDKLGFYKSSIRIVINFTLLLGKNSTVLFTGVIYHPTEETGWSPVAKGGCGHRPHCRRDSSCASFLICASFSICATFIMMMKGVMPPYIANNLCQVIFKYNSLQSSKYAFIFKSN